MQTTTTNHKQSLRWVARKPKGGFCFVPADVLLAAWWAYRRKIITLRDLRVWLACFELIARRCRLESARKPRYTAAEVQSITGCQNVVSIRQSTRRLLRVGLIARSGSRLTLPNSAEQLRLDRDGDFAERLRRVVNHRRRVPVPRTLCRYLARAGRASLIATAFGHLLRCLYYRDDECVSGGRCKASWIADVFELDLRTVKTARATLIEVRWLRRAEASQCQLNRWGLCALINLDWPPEEDNEQCKSPPPHVVSHPESPPPITNKKLSTRVGSNNQEPAKRGPDGGCADSVSLKPPDLRCVQRVDLSDPTRLQALFQQAARKRLVKRTLCDRLRFFGAAERAKRVGTSNPCGLFVALVRGGRWNFITQADEDRACWNVKRLDEPVMTKAIEERFGRLGGMRGGP